MAMMEPCPSCDGQGWTAESAHADGCDGSCREGNCPVQVQVQCPDCHGGERPGDRYQWLLRCPQCGWVDSYVTRAERDRELKRHIAEHEEATTSAHPETPVAERSQGQ